MSEHRARYFLWIVEGMMLVGVLAVGFAALFDAAGLPFASGFAVVAALLTMWYSVESYATRRPR